MDQSLTEPSNTVSLSETKRLALHQELADILGSASNVYFMPPQEMLLSYPAIVYYVGGGSDSYADNVRFLPRTTFDVTLIEYDPMSAKVDAIRDLKHSSYMTSFKKDGLHQHKFKITR